jgi:HprK-related kinase A
VESFCLHTGPFITQVTTHIQTLRSQVCRLYNSQDITDSEPFSDFHVQIAAPNILRRWIHPKIDFYLDGHRPYSPFHPGQALAMLEWGLNGCISGRAHQYIIFHAAAVERNGVAVILPGAPGSGKSTLTAAMVNTGWRLLTDELTLLDPNGGLIVPLSRPISLKNESIALIRNYAPSAVFSDEIAGTQKGTVALLRAPQTSLDRARETARPACLLFPRWERGAKFDLVPVPKALALTQMASQSFNVSVWGRTGFEALADLIESCRCYRIRYDSLEDTLVQLDRFLL